METTIHYKHRYTNEIITVEEFNKFENTGMQLKYDPYDIKLKSYVFDKPDFIDTNESCIDLQKVYKKWCKDTKRNGAILVGGSIREFIKVIEDSYEIKKK